MKIVLHCECHIRESVLGTTVKEKLVSSGLCAHNFEQRVDFIRVQIDAWTCRSQIHLVGGFHEVTKHQWTSLKTENEVANFSLLPRMFWWHFGTVLLMTFVFRKRAVMAVFKKRKQNMKKWVPIRFRLGIQWLIQRGATFIDAPKLNISPFARSIQGEHKLIGSLSGYSCRCLPCINCLRELLYPRHRYITFACWTAHLFVRREISNIHGTNGFEEPPDFPVALPVVLNRHREHAVVLKKGFRPEWKRKMKVEIGTKDADQSGDFGVEYLAEKISTSGILMFDLFLQRLC